jgi:hypothetical protein
MAAAAVVDKVSQECVHSGDIGTVHDRATIPGAAHESGAGQDREMR